MSGRPSAPPALTGRTNSDTPLLGGKMGFVRGIAALAAAYSIFCGADASLASTPLSAPPMIKQDPIFVSKARRAGDRALTVSIRLIEHGVSFPVASLVRQLKAAEAIYSQCEGVRFHVQVTGRSLANDEPGVRLWERLTDVKNGNVFFAPEFFQFFGPFAVERKAGVIDVHLVEHMNSTTREEIEHGQLSIIDLGTAFGAEKIEKFNGDTHAAAVGGDTLVLGLRTLQAVEGKTIKYPPLWAKAISYSSSLLAHELGHILLEDLSASEYRDHYCQGVHSDCPADNLMTAGGYQDNVYFSAKYPDEIAGYSPLPRLESAQCVALKNNRLVR